MSVNFKPIICVEEFIKRWMPTEAAIINKQKVLEDMRSVMALDIPHLQDMANSYKRGFGECVGIIAEKYETEVLPMKIDASYIQSRKDLILGKPINPSDN